MKFMQRNWLIDLRIAFVALGICVAGYAQSNPPTPSGGVTSNDPAKEGDKNQTIPVTHQFLLSVVSQPPNIKRPPEQPTVSAANAQQTQNKSADSNWWGKPEWWSAGGTVFVSLLAVAQGVLFFLQVRGTHENTVSQLRAYIQIIPIRMYGLKDPATNQPSTPPKLAFKIVNYGQTPAKAVSVGCGLFLGPKNPGAGNNLPVNTLPRASSPVDVFPNANLDDSRQSAVEVGMSNILTPAEISAIISGERTLCVMGKAAYKDVFKKSRPLEFCFALSCKGAVMINLINLSAAQSIPIDCVFIENGNRGD